MSYTEDLDSSDGLAMIGNRGASSLPAQVLVCTIEQNRLPEGLSGTEEK